jgi:hypothetical protein
MMFLIEATFGATAFNHHLVKAKTYEEACSIVHANHGLPDAKYKLLGIFEQQLTEKKLFRRIN